MKNKIIINNVNFRIKWYLNLINIVKDISLQSINIMSKIIIELRDKIRVYIK